MALLAIKRGKSSIRWRTKDLSTTLKAALPPRRGTAHPIAKMVNLAARLCSQASAGQILVDPKVYAAVEVEVDAEPAGELTLKGLSRAIKAFNIKTLVAA